MSMHLWDHHVNQKLMKSVTEDKRKNNPHQPVGRWIRVEKRLAIYLRDGFKCVMCGKSLRAAEPRTIHLDHLVPQSQGGSNADSNVYTSCADCNHSRSTRRLSSALERKVRAAMRKPLAPHRERASKLMEQAQGKYGAAFKLAQGAR